MPKRCDLEKILVLGAGPIVIGQACEFDYSGTQACNALTEEGYKVILINSNPATIMTDADLSYRTYIESIDPQTVECIIAKDRPDALLPTVGGQVALNCALSLEERGILKKYNVELLGADVDTIKKAEDRAVFGKIVASLGLKSPTSKIAYNMDDVIEMSPKIEWPVIIRPSFTLGGSGGGIAYNKKEFLNIALEAFSFGSVVQIDCFLEGWKEYEMEVIRDRNDNCIVVCSIENIDPMGVHTGDSVTVAPAMTLTDKEYQKMRDASFAVLRAVNVNTGGANVQFAVNPDNGEMLVIEMNPRVSRSSALASKATGFPIAKVAAKLAVGYLLNEIINECTGGPASFEPMIDYIVVKIPKFNFDKFAVDDELSSSMKSVGEVMAIGRNFNEALQKAMVSLEENLTGLDSIISLIVNEGNDVKKQEDFNAKDYKKAIIDALSKRTHNRLRLIADGLRCGLSFATVKNITGYDIWFIERIAEIVAAEDMLTTGGLPGDSEAMLYYKKQGFTDARIAFLVNGPAGKYNFDEHDIRQHRKKLGVIPVYRRIDTCAAEFAVQTNYMYGSYETSLPGKGCEAGVSDREKIIILGSGPNRIGQGIEFDYACVHAAYALRDAGYEVIMINCNPETVSTDYNTSDRLYFEPLIFEKTADIIDIEQAKGTLKGVVLQFGGQTPLKLVDKLVAYGVPILGSSCEAIVLAEDRELFKDLIQKLSLKQPLSMICAGLDSIEEAVKHVGYPLLIRPSYVLGGSAMSVIRSEFELQKYVDRYRFAAEMSGNVLVDSFLDSAIEIDVDAIGDVTGDVYVAGIMEHIEEAGIHSGDSCCCIPARSLSPELIERIRAQAVMLGKAIGVVGLFNVQCAVKNNDIYVLEVNVRSSRTVPFVAKVTGVSLAKIAALVAVGGRLCDLVKPVKYKNNIVAVKKPVFPFIKFKNVDVSLTPEMKSTGEVMGIESSFGGAFIKAHDAIGCSLPLAGSVFISVKDSDKPLSLNIARQFIELGFVVLATSGTADYLNKLGLQVTSVRKVREGRPHVVDMLFNNEIDYVVNTTSGRNAVTDNLSIRRTLLLKNIPYSTTINGAFAALTAITEKKKNNRKIIALQDIY